MAKTKRLWWKLGIGIIVVFTAGFSSGVIGTIVVGAQLKERAEDPAVGHSMVLNHLTRKLDLDETQQTEISSILSEMIIEIVEIRDDTRSRLAGVVRKHAPRIRAVLYPHQRAPFENFLSKLEREWHVVFQIEQEEKAPLTKMPPES
ncbi:MAG: hypothetical protein AAF585_29145 [Verrucomicrobiota bacterium]